MIPPALVHGRTALLARSAGSLSARALMPASLHLCRTCFFSHRKQRTQASDLRSVERVMHHRIIKARAVPVHGHWFSRRSWRMSSSWNRYDRDDPAGGASNRGPEDGKPFELSHREKAWRKQQESLKETRDKMIMDSAKRMEEQERRWQEKREAMAKKMDDLKNWINQDPYEAIFGWSNRRLRGLPLRPWETPDSAASPFKENGISKQKIKVPITQESDVVSKPIAAAPAPIETPATPANTLEPAPIPSLQATITPLSNYTSEIRKPGVGCRLPSKAELPLPSPSRNSPYLHLEVESHFEYDPITNRMVKRSDEAFSHYGQDLDTENDLPIRSERSHMKEVFGAQIGKDLDSAKSPSVADVLTELQEDKVRSTSVNVNGAAAAKPATLNDPPKAAPPTETVTTIETSDGPKHFIDHGDGVMSPIVDDAKASNSPAAKYRKLLEKSYTELQSEAQLEEASIAKPHRPAQVVTEAVSTSAVASGTETTTEALSTPEELNKLSKRMDFLKRRLEVLANHQEETNPALAATHSIVAANRAAEAETKSKSLEKKEKKFTVPSADGPKQFIDHGDGVVTPLVDDAKALESPAAKYRELLKRSDDEPPVQTPLQPAMERDVRAGRLAQLSKRLQSLRSYRVRVQKSIKELESWNQDFEGLKDADTYIFREHTQARSRSTFAKELQRLDVEIARLVQIEERLGKPRKMNDVFPMLFGEKPSPKPTAAVKEAPDASLLKSEIDKTKTAMTLAEEKAAPRRDTARKEMPVASDSAIKSTNAPEESKLADYELVDAIKDIYENEYGDITVNHQQGRGVVKESQPKLTRMEEATWSTSTLNELAPEEPAAKVNAAFPDSSKATPAPPSAIYTVLAFDPSTSEVSSTTMSAPVSSNDESIPLTVALTKLSQPAKFLPHLRLLRDQGFTPISSTKNLLVLRSNAPGSPAPKPSGQMPIWDSERGTLVWPAHKEHMATRAESGAEEPLAATSEAAAGFEGESSPSPKRVEPVFSGPKHASYGYYGDNLSRRRRRRTWRRWVKGVGAVAGISTAVIYTSGVSAGMSRVKVPSPDQRENP